MVHAINLSATSSLTVEQSSNRARIGPGRRLQARGGHDARLPCADPEANWDGLVAWLCHMLDDQAAAGEGVEQFRQRMVPHADASADVGAPPRGFLVPSGQPVGGMGENAAIVHQLRVRPVETRMNAVEGQQPAGG